MAHHQEIVVIRKKGKGHHGHHGGAWKVAYADFVTAMMALFIVLWLMNADDSTKKAISGYFRDPAGVGKEVGSSMAGVGEDLNLSRTDLDKLKEKIQAAFRKLPEFKGSIRDQVEMMVTTEGLRIEFLETEKGLFFESGSERPTAPCRELLAKLVDETRSLPNKLLVEGHTDSHLFSGKADYTNWELSAGRANAARRVMVASGLKESQISQVRGYADQRLRRPKDSTDPANRRISVVIQSGPGDFPVEPKASAASHAPPPAQGKASQHP